MSLKFSSVTELCLHQYWDFGHPRTPLLYASLWICMLCILGQLSMHWITVQGSKGSSIKTTRWLYGGLRLFSFQSQSNEYWGLLGTCWWKKCCLHVVPLQPWAMRHIFSTKILFSFFFFYLNNFQSIWCTCLFAWLLETWIIKSENAGISTMNIILALEFPVTILKHFKFVILRFRQNQRI